MKKVKNNSNISINNVVVYPFGGLSEWDTVECIDWICYDIKIGERFIVKKSNRNILSIKDKGGYEWISSLSHRNFKIVAKAKSSNNQLVNVEQFQIW